MWSNWQSRRIYIVRFVVGFVEHFSFHFFILNAYRLSLSLETSDQKKIQHKIKYYPCYDTVHIQRTIEGNIDSIQ